MKTLKRFIYILCVIFVFGCDQSSKKAENVKTLLPQNNESFESFFEKFNRDSVFQMSRVVFPFKVMQINDVEGPDNDEITYTNVFVAENDWKKVDFTFPNEKNVIVNKVEVNSDEVNLQYRVEDTGIFVEHFFQKKQGHWWLTYAKDNSD